jgi:6-phosphogluconolactonase
MKAELRVFPSAEELVANLAAGMMQKIVHSKDVGASFSILLPGGTTPGLLFRSLAKQSHGKTKWDHVHFYWGDERCVPPTDPESNYRMARMLLLDALSIPEANIHRIRGEDEPITEARRYASELRSVPGANQGMPVFDLVLLGVGEDGHTASIFPDRMDLLRSAGLCEVSVHPATLRKRITVTGQVINTSPDVVFLVTGRNKANVVAEIIQGSERSKVYPAAYIKPANGALTWFLDKEAAFYLNEKKYVEDK